MLSGKGFDAYKAFLPRAETHSIEIACIEHGPREEGEWLKVGILKAGIDIFCSFFNNNYVSMYHG